MKIVHHTARSCAFTLGLYASVFATPGAFAQSSAPASATPADAAPLPEVTVTATRYAEPVKTLTYGASIITADEIRAAGVSSVSEAIIKLLGVPGQMDLSGGNNYTVDLRGFGSTANSNQVIIVDGMRLNDDDQSSPNLSAIPISAIQRIEVMRGAGAVQYGGGATGGVIVITTNAAAGQAHQNSAELSAEMGSRGLVDERASTVLAAGDYSLDVAGQDLRSSGNRDNFASQNTNLSATGQWHNDWLRLGLRAGNSALSSGWPGPVSAAQFSADPTQTNNPTDWGDTSTSNAGVFAQANLGDWQINADASDRTKRFSSSSGGYPYGYDVNAYNQSLRARNESRWGSLRNAVVVGLDQSQWTRIITATSIFGAPLGTVALASSNAWYVTDDLTFASGTHVNFGVRNEDSSLNEQSSGTQQTNNLSAWQLGVNQTLNSQWSVYAHTAQSYRLPNADDVTDMDSTNPLVPQVSRDNEIGVRWDTTAHHVELRVFHSSLSNEIGFDPNGNGVYGPGSGANVNLDPTVHQGVELETRHTVGADVDLRLNAAARQATFVSGAYAGNNLAQVPAQTAAVSVDWRPAAGHAVNAGAHWVSQQNVDFANTCVIPAYTTLDTRYAYTRKNMELAFSVKNLTNEQYYTQAYTPCLPNGVSNAIYPEAGRTVSAALRLSF